MVVGIGYFYELNEEIEFLIHNEGIPKWNNVDNLILFNELDDCSINPVAFLCYHPIG